MSSKHEGLSLWQVVWYSFVLYLYRAYKFFWSFALRRFSDERVKWGVKFVFKKFGIRLDSGKDKADPVIHDTRFYRRVAEDFTLGLAESYMDGWWDCEDLSEMSFRMLRSPNLRIPLPMRVFYALGFNGNVNRQLIPKSKNSVEHHYDLGNELFINSLDKSMVYSCAYWDQADNLDQAQINKMELIAQKLKLKPGMRVLDLGSGWGGTAKYLAENHGVSVVGCTVSKQQIEYSRRSCQELPMVEFRYDDYRNINEKFDRVYSIEMIEHVGSKNYRTFFEVANRCLVDDGLFLVQSSTLLNKSLPRTEEFTDKYIFPNGEMPHDIDLIKYSQGLFIVEDIHNMSSDFPQTLEAWYDNFKLNWPKLQGQYDERFYRMWTFFLCNGIAAYRSRMFHCLQLVMSKRGLIGGYKAVR
ncbi:unnamed protein product [Cyprideis torosa]|uniref:Uncharacterized protein n=1 Tax=Cyprideis torosa TaxID=163714 RepID=A0A7R8WCC6_9CRUS|nr:unnamed protein product [Cyprideis torosa]CAG0891903.1 unnamed protein product [Cyprideis torosa]